MYNEGQTGEQMYVISEKEYEEFKFLKGVVQYGIPISVTVWVLLELLHSKN